HRRVGIIERQRGDVERAGYDRQAVEDLEEGQAGDVDGRAVVGDVDGDGDGIVRVDHAIVVDVVLQRVALERGQRLRRHRSDIDGDVLRGAGLGTAAAAVPEIARRHGQRIGTG